MPTAPRKSATPAAIASMMSVKEVCVVEPLTISARVRTRASGRFGFTPHTASRTAGSSASGLPAATRTAIGHRALA